MQPKLTTVPPAEIYQIPTCKKCKVPFVFHRPGSPGKYSETWKQSCNCDPGDVTRVHEPGGKICAIASYDGANTGKPIPRFCLFCDKPMQPGEQAYFGTMGPYSYGGYAHPACYQGWEDEKAKAQQEAEEANKGYAISFWYSVDDASKLAPSTGHSDRKSRLVPSDLPDFPEGSVVYEQYRRPFAMSHVEIPNIADAEAWWKEATKNENVAYELHWHGEASKNGKATRSWKGKGFSRVETEARKMEVDAGRGSWW